MLVSKLKAAAAHAPLALQELLKLSDNALSGYALGPLAPLPRLQFLSLSHNKVTQKV